MKALSKLDNMQLMNILMNISEEVEGIVKKQNNILLLNNKVIGF